MIQKIFFLFILLEYFLEFLAFGLTLKNKKQFIIETIACIYAFLYVLFSELKVMEERGYAVSVPEITNEFGGVFIFFQVLRNLKCKIFN